VRLFVGLSIVLAAGPATAERVIAVDVTGAPFDGRELAAAIRMRLPAQGTPVQVRVLATPGGVRVEARGGVRDVALDGLDGPTAARLVALAANDLLLDDLATPPAAAAADELTIGVVGAVAGWDGMLGGVTADVVLPRGWWLAAIEVGGGELVAGRIDLETAVIRASVGMRTGMFELRAGVTGAPVIVSSGGGDRTVLVGGGASARLRIPIAARVRAVLAGGLDVFATHTEYLVGGMPAMATPRAAPWFAVGMELTP
jgi:hypothetical protein